MRSWIIISWTVNKNLTAKDIYKNEYVIAW